ncbi:hypothetical protein, partial [Thermus sp. NMX2.A1]|uniref:hypothetical protein n=2 Tax=Thermaceae TaxID=188786 RepID=UPI003529B784
TAIAIPVLPRKHGAMHEKRLLTPEELRDYLGRDKVGRDLSYELARRYGVRLGRRWLVPLRVAEALAEGRLEELETPGMGPRGR